MVFGRIARLSHPMAALRRQIAQSCLAFRTETQHPCAPVRSLGFTLAMGFTNGCCVQWLRWFTGPMLHFTLQCSTENAYCLPENPSTTGIRTAKINKYLKKVPNCYPDSRRGKGCIVVLCNPCRNAEKSVRNRFSRQLQRGEAHGCAEQTGPIDKQNWIVIFSVAPTQ